MTGINNKKPATKPTKPEVKTQAVGKPPIIDWINYNNKIGDPKAKPFTDAEEKVAEATEAQMNGLSDRLQNARAFVTPPKAAKAKPYKYESWADQQKDAEVKKPTRMSASRSWQVIKQSMDKDELEEWYKDNPKDRPIELTPFKPDPMLEEIYQGTVVNPKFEAAKRQYLKDEEARRIEKNRTARAGIKTVLNFYK